MPELQLMVVFLQLCEPDFKTLNLLHILTLIDCHGFINLWQVVGTGRCGAEP